MRSINHQPSIVILGAGIAGLSAGYFFQKYGVRAVILEKSETYGGLARSFRWNNFWCDFAAHRFFTHNHLALKQVQSLVPLLHHQRRSQIYLNGSWMRDPIDIVDLAYHLPFRDTLRLLSSYLARDRNKPEDSFKNFVLKHYGQQFYEIFFRSYTERLFSIPGDQIAVEWARRKVRLASPIDRFKSATKTKFNSFYYPTRGGYGAIANALFEQVRDQVHFCAKVTKLQTDSDGKVIAVEYEQNKILHKIEADIVISTLPLTTTSRLLGIDSSLEYQKVDAVYLLINKPQMTHNHWLYFMDTESVINRLVEFKHMSPYDTDPVTTVVCAEVTRSIDNPVEASIQNLINTKLIKQEDVLDSLVIHEPFAYPRYTRGYTSTVKSLEKQINRHKNVFLLGRAAQFEHHEVDDIIGEAHRMVEQIMRPETQTNISTQKHTPLVWIVVLTFNNYKDTFECLASLRKLTYSNHRIVLVDNGSSDGTPERVRTDFPEVHVIENKANLGVPAGYNVGFRYALQQGADHVFMLNNDTVVDPGILEPLVKATETPGAAVLCPIVYYYDQPTEVWSAGAKYRPLPPAIIMEYRVHQLPQGYHELEYAISCGILITRQAFETVGLFDENFLFLWDDLDFSVRVRRHNMKIFQVPDAKMWHKVSRTTQPGSSLFWRTHGESGAIFYRRHGRPVYVAMLIHLSYFAVREFVVKWRWQFLKPFLQGFKEGVTRPLKDVPSFKDGLSYPG